MLGVLATGNNLLQGVEWLLKKKESGFRLERIDMREKRSDCNMQMRFSRDMYSTYSMYVKSIRNSNSNRERDTERERERERERDRQTDRQTDRLMDART